jgi:hypothetical protein
MVALGIFGSWTKDEAKAKLGALRRVLRAHKVPVCKRKMCATDML